ncbi:MAG: Lrp/AsnC family transcriptional regulator [Magnetococcales bacterium]|nr:Lrp/AsnC family transcriptional regulator [Magnetococcales bacterium]
MNRVGADGAPWQSDLSPLEQALMNELQGGFPIQERPFSQAAAWLRTTEEHLVACLERMIQRGRISRFGPLYNVERMGGAVTLAALAAPEDSFDEIAARVNAFPEVAHNYRRDHALNMWFVLATETLDGQARLLRRIEDVTGCTVLNFPKEEEFHIGFRLHVGDAGARIERWTCRSPSRNHGFRTSPMDRAIVMATQEGLPLDVRPYHVVGARTGFAPEQVMERMTVMLAAGAIRRLGIIPNHYGLGLAANGMTVWDVPDDRISELGKRVGGLPFVTHCYRRPRHPPHWPFSLFAMVHGQSRDEVGDQTAHIQRVLGDAQRGHEVLFSTRILKKNGLRLSAAPNAPSVAPALGVHESC